jgi:hypothetical protein
MTVGSKASPPSLAAGWSRARRPWRSLACSPTAAARASCLSTRSTEVRLVGLCCRVPDLSHALCDAAATPNFGSRLRSRLGLIRTDLSFSFPAAGWLFSPVDDSKCLIDKFPPSIENVLWDANDPNMFVAVDTKVGPVCPVVLLPNTAADSFISLPLPTRSFHCCR